MHSRFQNFSHTLLTVDEITTFAARVATEVTSRHAGEPFLSARITQMQTHLDEVHRLQARARTNEFTQEVLASDTRRDELLRAIKASIKNDLLIGEMRQGLFNAAQVIAPVLEANPTNCKAAYAEETAQINRLIRALQSSDVWGTVQESSIRDLFAALVAEQARFEELMHQQARSEAEELLGYVRVPMQAVKHQLTGVLNYIDLMATDSPALYQESAKTIEELIQKIMTPARARVGRTLQPN